MELIIFWLVMAGVVAIIASSKDRNAFGWFVYGFLIWPIALVHILVTQASQESKDRRALESGEKVKCPFCAELIRREARICPHCQRDVGEASPREVPESVRRDWAKADREVSRRELDPPKL